jgi:hypothetical protein
MLKKNQLGQPVFDEYRVKNILLDLSIHQTITNFTTNIAGTF